MWSEDRPEGEMQIEMKRIELVNQEDGYTCGVAAAAMVSRRPFSEVAALVENREAGMSHTEMDGLLHRLGVVFRRILYPRFPKAGEYIVTVPSLNLDAISHYVVIDLTDGEFAVFDPQYQRDGVRFYSRTRDEYPGENVKSYANVIQILSVGGERIGLSHLSEADRCIQHAREMHNRLLDRLDDGLKANNGSPHLQWDKKLCRCDASVGNFKCDYCAIHSALEMARQYVLRNETSVDPYGWCL